MAANVFFTVPVTLLAKNKKEGREGGTTGGPNVVRQLFQMTERLIRDQTQITGLTAIDRAVQLAFVKTDVFADSVLCLGGLNTEPIKAW